MIIGYSTVSSGDHEHTIKEELFKYFNVYIQSVNNTLYKQNQNLFRKF